MSLIRGKVPETADGVLAAMLERLAQDVGAHAVELEARGDIHCWTTCGDTLIVAMWACVHGDYDRPVLLPSGDAAPASTLVETYGLIPLWQRRVAATRN